MEKLYPKSLNPGDVIRIITPSRSASVVSQETKDIAIERFDQMGMELSFGNNINTTDEFSSSSIKERVDDIHDAFEDPLIKAIIPLIGGYNSNQLLRHLNWDIVRKNPKIFCGYSDIDVLNNAIYSASGLITYSGPLFVSFGQIENFDYTLEYFMKCMFSKEPYKVDPCEKWSDDEWYVDQDKRQFVKNSGWKVINPGQAEGRILGGNLCSFNLLQGTEFFPDLDKSILFLEDFKGTNPGFFDRDLQSLIHQPGFDGVRGLVIGRFQRESGVSFDVLKKIIKTKSELKKIPVISDVDFGHTYPKITFPIGGTARINISENDSLIEILSH